MPSLVGRNLIFTSTQTLQIRKKEKERKVLLRSRINEEEDEEGREAYVIEGNVVWLEDSFGRHLDLPRLWVVGPGFIPPNYSRFQAHPHLPPPPPPFRRQEIESVYKQLASIRERVASLYTLSGRDYLSLGV